MPRCWSSWANQHQYHSDSSHPSWPRALYHCSSHRRPGLFSIGRSFRTRLGLPAFFILRHSHSLTPLGKTKSLLMLIATPFINISWRYPWKHQSHRIPSPIMAQILEHYHFNNQQYELYWEWASLSPWISTLCCQVYRWVKPSEGKVGEVINKNRPPAVCFVSFVCGTLIKLSPSSSTFQTFQSVKHQHSTTTLQAQDFLSIHFTKIIQQLWCKIELAFGKYFWLSLPSPHHITQPWLWSPDPILIPSPQSSPTPFHNNICQSHSIPQTPGFSSSIAQCEILAA